MSAEHFHVQSVAHGSRPLIGNPRPVTKGF